MAASDKDVKGQIQRLNERTDKFIGDLPYKLVKTIKDMDKLKNDGDFKTDKTVTVVKKADTLEYMDS